MRLRLCSLPARPFASRECNSLADISKTGTADISRDRKEGGAFREAEGPSLIETAALLANHEVEITFRAPDGWV